MENEGTPRVPPIGTLVKIVLYCGAAAAIGVSFSSSLALLNIYFGLGVGWTLGNVFLLLILGRQVMADFYTPGS